MIFKEIKTREEFIETIPVMKQDSGGSIEDNVRADNFMTAIAHDYRHFAAYQDGQVVAVIGMTRIYNPNYQAYDITNMVVDQGLRRSGVGSALINFCKQVAIDDGVPCLRLGAYPDNYKALAFYQKNGFKHTANFMFQMVEAEK